MKCVKIFDTKKFEVVTEEEPVSRNGSVVFKVNACGICGSDIHYWDNGEPKGLIMGHEFSGTVIDPGSRSDLKAGDRITGLPISPCGVCHACKNRNPQYLTHDTRGVYHSMHISIAMNITTTPKPRYCQPVIITGSSLSVKLWRLLSHWHTAMVARRTALRAAAVRCAP